MTKESRTLTLERILDAPRAKLFRCWTEPELVKQWFAPAPWKIADAKVDVRTGGSSQITMESPDGDQFPSTGVYLEVIPDERIVFTDAYSSAWEPSNKPFFTAIVTFEDAGDGRTKYTATARHWTDEDRKAHEEMGFHDGWSAAADQLEALARTL